MIGTACIYPAQFPSGNMNVLYIFHSFSSLFHSPFGRWEKEGPAKEDTFKVETNKKNWLQNWLSKIGYNKIIFFILIILDLHGED